MSLDHVFNPKSIAVIGASTTVGSVGNDLVKNLVGAFNGKIFPVNLKGGELYGLPMYQSVADVPEKIDLAVIAVPAAVVLEVMEQLGQLQVPAAVVISAGFREAGNQELETKLVEVAERYGITLVGPNCLGVINPELQMNASFAPAMPPVGSIAFLSQSGALGSSILDYGQAHELGFSKFLSLGNKAAISEEDMLEYLAQDEQTKVILLYLEQLSDLDGVLTTALKIRRTQQPKPIIVLKSGQTEQGMKSAQSHTGALAGSDAFYEALFREAGIIRANSVEELFLYAKCFVYNPLLQQDRVAIVTNAGGLGVLVTDALVKARLELAELSPATVEQLKSFLPAAASTYNPIDILGDAPADRYQKALSAVLADTNVDAAIVLLTPQSMTEVENTARSIVEAKRQTAKPVVVNFLGGDLVAGGIALLEREHIAEAGFPEMTAQGLSVLHQFSLWQDNPHQDVYLNDFEHETISQILAQAKTDAEMGKNHGGWLSTEQMLRLMEACHVPLVPWKIVPSVAEVSGAVGQVGGEAVVKVISPTIVHKTEAGAVMLGVRAETAQEQVQALVDRVKAYDPSVEIQGLLVMQHVKKKNQEMLIGAVRDQRLGAIVGCGLGGVYTETFQDATFELVPLRYQDSQAMIKRLRMAPLLTGTRGEKPLAINAFAEIIDRVAYLIDKYPQIAELDVNPLFVFPEGEGAVVVDARVRLF